MLLTLIEQIDYRLQKRLGKGLFERTKCCTGSEVERACSALRLDFVLAFLAQRKEFQTLIDRGLNSSRRKTLAPI